MGSMKFFGVNDQQERQLGNDQQQHLFEPLSFWLLGAINVGQHAQQGKDFKKRGKTNSNVCLAVREPRTLHSTELAGQGSTVLQYPFVMSSHDPCSIPVRLDGSKPDECISLPTFGAVSLAEWKVGNRHCSKDCLYFAGGRIWTMDWLPQAANPKPGLLLRVPESTTWAPHDTDTKLQRRRTRKNHKATQNT